MREWIWISGLACAAAVSRPCFDRATFGEPISGRSPDAQRMRAPPHICPRRRIVVGDPNLHFARLAEQLASDGACSRPLRVVVYGGSVSCGAALRQVAQRRRGWQVDGVPGAHERRRMPRGAWPQRFVDALNRHYTCAAGTTRSRTSVNRRAARISFSRRLSRSWGTRPVDAGAEKAAIAKGGRESRLAREHAAGRGKRA